MGAKFYFFTDPDLLAPQTAQQAYGPVAAVDAPAGKDQFRVTDLHSRKSGSTDAMPAFAICNGILCAQTDDNGTLSLILKPIQQPPFDFPFISYVIYKGVDPASLLVNGNATAGGTIDTSKAADNKLVDSIQKSWDANLNTGSPTRECLGLHLTPASTAAVYPDLVLGNYADGEPLDRLFYQGDGKFQLPLVRGGWRIADFAAAAFGMEIVVERIGYRPKIGLVRKLENVISVGSLDPTTTYATNDVTYFMHWHAKEECLNFIDPCSFWGSFFVTKLRAWSGANTQFDKLSGNAIYETVLRGAATGAANFANRNRAYLDIRNEHGNSLNYYQADGPNIQLTLDAGADIDTCEVNYYASGWPSFAIDDTSLPAGSSGDKIDVRFALPKTANTRPLLYLSAGYIGRFRRVHPRARLLECTPRDLVPFLEEALLTLPLVDDGGTPKIAASYQKICSFKRSLLLEDQSGTSSSTPSVAPQYLKPLDHIFPMVDDDAASVASGSVHVRLSADEILVDVRSSGTVPFVGRLGLAQDASNACLFAVPIVFVEPEIATELMLPSAMPAYLSVPSGDVLQDFLSPRMSKALVERRISPNAQEDVGSEVMILDLSSKPSRPRRPTALDRLVLLVVTHTELASARTLAGGAQTVPGSARFVINSDQTFAREGKLYAETRLALSFLETGASGVTRQVAPVSTAVCSDARTL